MEKLHLISFENSNENMLFLKSINAKFTNGIALTFEISENDPKWIDVSNFIKCIPAVDIIKVIYTSEEIENANFYIMDVENQKFYPQPEKNFLYINKTYNTDKHCKECGIGLKQINPFHIKNKIQWKSNTILKLNWINDELFVNPEIWDDIINKFNIPTWPVISNNDKSVIENIVQLKIESLFPSELKFNNNNVDKCSKCNNIRHSPSFIDVISKNNNCNFDIVKSNEYLGTGHNAYKLILISKKLHKELIKCKIIDYRLTPLNRLS